MGKNRKAKTGIEHMSSEAIKLVVLVNWWGEVFSLKLKLPGH